MSLPLPKPRLGDPEVNLQAAERHGLTAEEWSKALALLGRTPTWTELGIFSVMWSEHCSYKSSRLHLARLPVEGPQVLQGPGENAGVVDLGDGWALAFKMESHNHPSYIEPKQGAATGVGGIMRDVFTMGARPVANLNSLRFGWPDHPKTSHLVAGVVEGVGSYGNCMGVPTVGGEVHFDPSYNGNCLVNAFTAGLLRADKIFRGAAAGPGNPVLYVGATTGRDGIHGATMASESFEAGSEEKRPTVQVGDPFTEKLLLEACLELMATDCIVGIQDMGAAGLTSSSFEMAGRAGTGLRLDLDAVPRREVGMTPYELMLSESQERMLMVVTRGREGEAQAIFEKWDLCATVVGEVTDDGRVVVLEQGAVVADLPAAPLAEEAPRYDRPQQRPPRLEQQRLLELQALPPLRDVGEAMLRLLHTPELASKRWVFRQYDHMVRLGASLRPAESDAALVRLPEAGKTIALSVDCNARITALDPREGGRQAVAEAARNVACSGARPLAITDCLNFGNPERPEVMWQLSEAIDGIAEACLALHTPVTGGNVSLYNETQGQSILPTPTIAAVGLLEPRTRGAAAPSPLGSTLGGVGQRIALLGPAQEISLAGSAYLFHLHGLHCGQPVSIDLALEARLQRLLVSLNQEGLLLAAHDLSEGGLLIGLCELLLGRREPADPALGLELALPKTGQGLATTLFGEGPSRVLVAFAAQAQAALEARVQAAGLAFQLLGESTATPRLRLLQDKECLCDEALWILDEVWRTGFASSLGVSDEP